MPFDKILNFLEYLHVHTIAQWLVSNCNNYTLEKLLKVFLLFKITNYTGKKSSLVS